jgi:glycosyltransferase involved in cell wall biosynthesis
MEFDETLSVGVLLSSAGLARGGLETIAVQFARGLAMRGHDVSLVAGYWPGRSLATGLIQLPVQWHRLPCIPLNLPVWGRLAERLRPGLALKSQSRSFYRACRLHPVASRTIPGFDVTLTFLEGESVRFSAWREQHGRPNVSYFPGVIDANELGHDRSRIRVAISRTVAEHADVALNLPIDGVIRPGLSSAWLDGEYRVRPEGRRLIYVGRLEANKGVRELLAILGRLDREIDGLSLRLAGDGPLRKSLCAEAGWRERVLCLGDLSPERLREELRQADLFVFPSHYESFGIAVLEALAIGVPVICSELPALREAAGEAARFSPAGDVAAWADAVGTLLADVDERRRLSFLGRERARRFTWSRAVAELENTLYQALELEAAVWGR